MKISQLSSNWIGITAVLLAFGAIYIQDTKNIARMEILIEQSRQRADKIEIEQTVMSDRWLTQQKDFHEEGKIRDERWASLLNEVYQVKLNQATHTHH